MYLCKYVCVCAWCTCVIICAHVSLCVYRYFLTFDVYVSVRMLTHLSSTSLLAASDRAAASSSPEVAFPWDAANATVRATKSKSSPPGHD